MVLEGNDMSLAQIEKERREAYLQLYNGGEYYPMGPEITQTPEEEEAAKARSRQARQKTS
jgi:hypothetical protein